MNSLTEFLRERADELEAEEADRQAKVAEWRQSVSALLGQMKDWLRQADTRGVLKVRDDSWDRREEGLGSYTVPGLTLRLGPRQVHVVPNSRYVVASIHPPGEPNPRRAAGRVDITDETDRHVLYRLQTDGGDLWFMDIDVGGGRPFGREAFETALLRMLK